MSAYAIAVALAEVERLEGEVRRMTLSVPCGSPSARRKLSATRGLLELAREAVQAETK